jgi:excisionase family DNA binding protein
MINNIELPAPETVKAAQMAPLFYDINEAAQVLNMSTKTVRRLLWRGKLTSCKAIRKILIPRKQIEEFIKVSCDTPNLTA